MTIAITRIAAIPQQPQAVGQSKVVYANVAFSGTWTDEGEAITASTVGLTRIDGVLFGAAAAAAGESVILPVFGSTAGKVTLYDATFAEMSGALGDTYTAFAQIIGV